MPLSRRALIRSAAVAAAGTGALASCTRGSTRPDRSTAPPPTSAPEDPSSPLVLGTIGTSLGLEAMFDKQIAIAVGEAATDVNIAGGVFGQDLVLLERHTIADPGDDLADAIAALAEAGATGVVVSCDDDVLLAAMPAFVDAGMAVVSVTSTSMSLRADDAATSGMLVRLTASDRALAAGFAESAGTGGAVGSVFYLARDTTSGHSLGAQLRRVVEPAGGTYEERYHAGDQPDLGEPIDAALASGAPLVVVSAGEETSALVGALVAANTGPDGSPLRELAIRTLFYGSAAPGDALPPDTMRSVTGTRAGIPAPDALKNIMLRVDPSLAPDTFDFAGQAYDAVTLLALAAQTAHSAEGTRLAAAIPDLLAEGDEAGSYAEARTLQRDGATARYVGFSGPLELGEDGDPASAEITTVSYDEANTVASTNDVTVTV
ncbi:ABC transporter substrate-binding protein [Brachybacterium huguangmaarense]|uniref:ABC transporter substrate-binding protein n=1 Tax=Brachybacterium huguangmaarense TaxID=1652028 RepID=A0ABY6G1A5_9MICO|nr:ABC transporter substrate-binding protein [Brachybacterium huguangmaarense]UYG16426.1 ABC transporter substrate-binding protein [Brachybacterium huguangmaarense]